MCRSMKAGSLAGNTQTCGGDSFAMDNPPIVPSGRAPAARGSKRWLIALYIVVALLYWISLYLYVPTLPTYAQSKSESLSTVGMILAQYGLWQAVIRLPLGIAADWLGKRKPFILVGIGLSGLGAWLMGTAESAEAMAIGRAVTGLAAGTWVPLITVFSSLFPPQEAVRASAILSTVSSAGRVAATSVTGSLNQTGGYALAYYLAATTAAVGILFALPAREPIYPSRRPSAAGIGRLITRRDVLVPSLLAAVSQYVAWSVSFGFLQILARQLGATDVMQSMMVSLYIGLATLGSLISASAAGRIHSRHLVYAAFTMLFLGTNVVAVAPTLPLVFAGQFCLGLGQGLGYPVLMGLSIQDVSDDKRTTAMGLHQAVYAIGMSCGPWLSGMMADAVGIRPMLGGTALASLAVSLILIRLLPSRS